MEMITLAELFTAIALVGKADALTQSCRKIH